MIQLNTQIGLTDLNNVIIRYLNLPISRRVCCILSRGRVVRCVCLRGIAIRGTRTVAETALITELTHALFEEATSDNRAMG